jgi:hypothetical protein
MHSMFKQETKTRERFVRARFLKATNAIDYHTGKSLGVERDDCVDISESDGRFLQEAGFVLVLTRPEMPAK